MRHIRNHSSKVAVTDTVSTSVAAKLLGMSNGSIIRLCSSGRLPHIMRVIGKPPGERVIKVSDIMNLATELGQEVSPIYMEKV